MFSFVNLLNFFTSSVDKSVLIEIIMTLNNGGYMFTIDESTITVEGGAAEDTYTEESYDEEAYLDDALAV